MVKYITERLEDTLDELMLELEKYYGCESGDVDPWTAMEIENATTNLAKLLARVIRDNQK